MTWREQAGGRGNERRSLFGGSKLEGGGRNEEVTWREQAGGRGKE